MFFFLLTLTRRIDRCFFRVSVLGDESLLLEQKGSYAIYGFTNRASSFRTEKHDEGVLSV